MKTAMKNPVKTLCFWLLMALPAFAEAAAPDAETLAVRPVVSEVLSPASAGDMNFVGVVTARTETDLAFLLIGTVASRPVEVGDLLKAGDLVAQLDPEELDANLRESEAGVAVARAQLRAASDTETRARELSARGVGTTTRLEDASRGLASAEARLAQAEAALARARDARSFATLLAPQDGIITNVFAETGTTLAAGQPIARLAAIDEREIVVDVSAEFVAALDLGMVFNVSLAAAPAVTTTATFSRIDAVAERTTRTRRLHLTMDTPPGGFRLGALAHVSLPASTKAGLSIPRQAAWQDGDSLFVWVVNRATDTVHRTKVTLGEVSGDRARVLSGLSTGEEIVIKGVHSLQEGQTVGAQVTE